MKPINPNTLIIAAGAGLLVAWYLNKLGGGIITGWKKFVEGVNFDEKTLGPKVELTPAAKMTQEHYIEMGYLEVLPDGRTRITPEGEDYIRQMQATQ